MQFRLLGPFDVRTEGRVVPIIGHRTQTLLCALLLSRGEVVPTDRLIDALWGDTPPPGALHALHVHASKLRAALRAADGDTVQVRTEAGGYRLLLDGHQLDVVRFGELVAAGRRELEAHQPEAAVSALRSADDLWRGAPLGEFAHEPFAQPEIARLTELHLISTETRIEAEMTVGDAATVVPELEGLVAAHPLRERLSGLLMLALYRTGRQARALEVYRQTRELLAEELGVDPSPELQQLMQQVLSHDPKLRAATGPGGDSPPVSAPLSADATDRPAPALPASPGARRHRGRWLVAGVAALVAVGVFVAVAARRGGPTAARPRFSADVISAYDFSGRMRAQFPVGRNPSAIAAADGSLWVANEDDNTVTRIDPATGHTTTIGDIGDTPAGIAVGAGSAWVVSPTNAAHGATAVGTVTPVNPHTDSATTPFPAGQLAAGIAYGDHAVWVAATEEARIYRFDPTNPAKVIGFDTGTAPTGLAVTGTAVWVTNAGDNTVSALDPVTGTRLRKPIPVGLDPVAVAVGDGGAWVANHLDGDVSWIDPVSGRTIRTIPVGEGPSGVAVAHGAVWVTTEQAGGLVRIDPATGHHHVIPVPGAPRAIVATGDRVYVASGASYQGHAGGQLRIRIAGPQLGSGEPVLDPTFSADFVTALLGPATTDTLVGYAHAAGPAGASLVPDLAEALPAPTPRTTSYTFTLRPHVRFSTGKPLAAHDVRASFERAFLSDPGDVQGTALASIRGAAACRRSGARVCNLDRGVVVDDAQRTVRFELTRPEPKFLTMLATEWATIVPTGTPVMHWPDFDKHHEPVPGTGPYKVSEVDWPRRIVLVRNPYFHQWSLAAQPAGYASSIVIERTPSTPRNLSDLETGKIDILDDQDLTPGQEREAVTGHPVVIRAEGGGGVRFAFLNTRMPPFDNLKARQALNYAIDRQKLIDLRGSAQSFRPTCQLIIPGTTGYRPYCPYTLNPDATGTWTAPNLPMARKLVAESGTGGDRVVVWQAPKKAEPSPRYFVDVLNELGYHAVLRRPFANFGDYVSGIFAGHAQIGTLGYTSPADGGDQIQGWTCGFTDNPGRYCNRRFDALYRHGLDTQLTDPSAANELWAQLDRMLVRDAAVVPVWTDYPYALVSTRVGNWSPNVAAGLLLPEMWVR
jgi:peptide/nickel transport system substrate-binding protein